MKRPRTLQAFTPEQYDRAKLLLAARVAQMMGRKFEEGDWSYVYCRAKGIPERAWSNLNIDVMHEGLGVEHKMLRHASETSITVNCGTTLMHPSATRAIRIGSTDVDPNVAMRDVLGQYAALIEERRKKVQGEFPGAAADMRTGWLLWQSSLREFLYFEEEMLRPNPEDYFAEWRESGGGARKKSKNLWVFEKETQKKRYSVTTHAGVKIQPYFDVPAPKNVYIFRVQSETLDGNLVRLWVSQATAHELERILGGLDADRVSTAVLEVADIVDGSITTAEPGADTARPIDITKEAHAALIATFEAVSDEHMVQLLIGQLRRE